MKPVRWRQRFENYLKALDDLNTISGQAPLSAIQELGLIKAFELTFEMAWKTLRDYLMANGRTESMPGSKTVFRYAYQEGLIEDGPVWLRMAEDRNMTSHEYIIGMEETVSRRVHHVYIPLLNQLAERLTQQRS